MSAIWANSENIRSLRVLPPVTPTRLRLHGTHRWLLMRAITKRASGIIGGCLGSRRRRRVAKHIAAAPHRFDVVIAAGRLGEFFAQLAEENVDDLQLRLVRSVIETVKKHFLREDGTLAQAEELEDGVLRAGHMHWLVVDRDNPGIEIDGQLACPDRRYRVALGRADDRLNGN